MVDLNKINDLNKILGQIAAIKKDISRTNNKKSKKSNNSFIYYKIQNKTKFTNIINIYIDILKNKKDILLFFHIMLGYLLNISTNKQGIIEKVGGGSNVTYKLGPNYDDWEKGKVVAF